MIHFNGKRWVPFDKKITYTREFVVFDHEQAPYEHEDNFQVVDNELSDEQLYRLEVAQGIQNIPFEDLVLYVKDGVTNELSMAAVADAIKKELDRESMKSAIDFENSDIDVLEKIDLLRKDYSPQGYYLRDDLVEYEGGLYLVLHDHPARLDLPPSTTPTLYVLRKSGTPDNPGEPEDWTQPGGGDDRYKKGSIVKHNGNLWISTIDGLNVAEPGVHGWKPYSPTGEPMFWVSGVSYDVDSVVSHKEQIWISTFAGANIWEPGVYGWEVKP